mmetsp:Transcript_10179/g.33311  ORF Transcript_10179/g.33311 Transcript_10179/m.33311 type:complete len:230 (+) Transcript_10179:64-753(+)
MDDDDADSVPLGQRLPGGAPLHARQTGAASAPGSVAPSAEELTLSEFFPGDDAYTKDLLLCVAVHGLGDAVEGAVRTYRVRRSRALSPDSVSAELHKCDDARRRDSIPGVAGELASSGAFLTRDTGRGAQEEPGNSAVQAGAGAVPAAAADDLVRRPRRPRALAAAAVLRAPPRWGRPFRRRRLPLPPLDREQHGAGARPPGRVGAATDGRDGREGRDLGRDPGSDLFL